METLKNSAPPTPRHPRLSNGREVCRELGRLYRRARHDHLPAGDASKLAHVLAILARTFEDSDLERRVETLERRPAA